jgi:hydroxypyruvate isomerase
VISRRNILQTAGAAALASTLAADTDAPAGGRIKQSVARWCFKSYSVDQLAQHAKRIGLKGMDLLDPPDWPIVQKYGLVPAMVPEKNDIGNGFNRLENHDKLVKDMEGLLAKAAAAGVPNVIAMSGNRKGMSDSEGAANCVTGLNRCKKMAEDKGVTICMELLNSKINHHDYMCDHTAWGVEVMKRVDSPRVKLLYDIYHMQIMEGDLIRTIRDNINYIGHFHTGGVPDRHELSETQEVNWRGVALAIADLGYKGFVAHEFVPTAADPIKSLEQAYQIFNV